jgi:predicted dithiol-disulfide oxidoreductase (DUF899 family)
MVDFDHVNHAGNRTNSPRNLETLWGMYQWLDRAPRGRNETRAENDPSTSSDGTTRYDGD